MRSAFKIEKHTSTAQSQWVTPNTELADQSKGHSNESPALLWAINRSDAARDSAAVTIKHIRDDSVPSSRRCFGASKPNHVAASAGKASKKAGASVSGVPYRETMNPMS